MAQPEASEETVNWKTPGWKIRRCKFCKLFKTSSVSCMKQHVKRHEVGLRPFNCEIGKVEWYFCKDCEFTADVAVGLKQHILQYHSAQCWAHMGSRQYVCRNCGFQTHFILVWFKHFTEGCDDEIKIKDDHSVTEGAITFYKCNICPYQTKCKGYLQRHNTAKHVHKPQMSYKCDKCEYKCKSKSNLSRHNSSKHLAISFYKCNMCPYQTEWKGYLQRHNTAKHVQHPQIWYNCDECEYKCKTESNLSRHRSCKHLEEHEIHWYSCHKCEFRTKVKFALTKHNIFNHLKHDEIQWYYCDICKFTTKDESYLRKHIINKHLQDDEIQ